MSTQRRRPVRRVIATALAAATAVAIAAPPVQAASPDPFVLPLSGGTGTSPATALTPFSATVTLITGDAVHVSTVDGRPSVSPIPGGGAGPGAGASTTFFTEATPDGDVYVYPQTAMRAVASGLLDRELFNITTLAADGYDDARSATLPVIVQYAPGMSAETLSAKADALPASTEPLALPDFDAAAIDVTKTEAADFFASLGGGTGANRQLAARQISKIWLDGRYHLNLEQSVPQIGAPDAWAAGYDGTGVKVAVLDTGVDPNHPDLAGRVTTTKSFVDGEPTIQDGNGHGTHVAATIAGSGNGSNGLRKGVAPGAELIVGKVLSADGYGDLSWILDGMSWAAQQDADVISMSLGGDTTNPSDILTDAVDSLTAEYGTLFVIAAGNSGRNGENTIGSPGTADSALTVGAVDKQDVLADFSSRGPRPGDFAIKPEITAPGVNIIAARAEGTSLGTPIDEKYAALSGTSMATPHVAGAAAILKQRHPEMTWEQLKNALASTANTHGEYNVYQQGAGRVNLTEATTATVFASAKADFGRIAQPDGVPSTPVTRTVTYRNTGTADVTLDLALNLDRGQSLVDGEASLSGTTLSVPAGGTADATITVDPGLGSLGQHDGYLTATADGVSLTTAVGYVRAEPEYALSVKGIDRNGRMPGTVAVQVWSKELGSQTLKVGFAGLYGDTGSDTYTVMVPKGHYLVQVRIATNDAEQPDSLLDGSHDYFVDPDVDVTHDNALTVDARQAEDLKLTVDGEKREMEESYFNTGLASTRADNRQLVMGVGGLVDGNTVIGLVPSTKDHGDGHVELFNERGFREPLAKAVVTGKNGRELDIRTDPKLPRTDGTVTLTPVSAGAGSEEDFANVDVKGKLAVIDLRQWSALAVQRAQKAGAAAVLITRVTDGPVHAATYGTSIPVYSAMPESGRYLFERMAAGPVQVEVTSRSESRFTYQVPGSWKGESLPENPVYTAHKRDFAKMTTSYYSDGGGRLQQVVNTAVKKGYVMASTPLDYVWAGTVRDEYILARPDLSYTKTVQESPQWLAVPLNGNTTVYQPGKSYSEDWFRGPLHAGAQLSPCGFCRTDKDFRVGMRIWGDSDPSHWAGWGFGSIAERWYRDGVEMPWTEAFVPEEATYKVDLTRTRYPSPNVSFGGSVNTTWEFKSHAPTGPESPECAKLPDTAAKCTVFPVILTGYDAPLNLYNQARAGHKYSFDLSTYRAPGFTGDPAITGAKVSVSYDDGATWTAADVELGADGRHEVSYRHPKLGATNGFASLKVEVWDAAGNRTTETFIRAYGLV